MGRCPAYAGYLEQGGRNLAMTLVLIFFGIFFGVILSVVGLATLQVAVTEGAVKLRDWLMNKTGRSQNEVAVSLYVVFVALLLAVYGTIAFFIDQ
jgi:hypothetical protein